MEAFVWDENFVTGISAVDEQHHSLVNLFNELNDSWLAANGSQEAVLQRHFDRIVDYTRFHFAEEESMMLKVGVDARHREQHAQIHARFVAEVSELWRTHSTMRDPAQQFIGFLASWLALHILGVDQDMARQIDRIRNGGTPQAAYEMEATAPAHEGDVRALLGVVGKLYHVLSGQNAKLAEANTTLEAKVLARTLELEHANETVTHAYKLLEQYSHTDGLLQIANRTYFDDRLKLECARAFRSRSPLGLLMIDVDFFKRYNDLYGHQAGDRCLQAVAAAVSSACRRATDLVARYGGEELCVILPDTDQAGTQLFAGRVCEAVSAMHLPHADSSVADHVTVSVGAVSAVPESPQADQKMLNLADVALYRSKETGRNRVSMAEPLLQTSAQATPPR